MKRKLRLILAPLVLLAGLIALPMSPAFASNTSLSASPAVATTYLVTTSSSGDTVNVTVTNNGTTTVSSITSTFSKFDGPSIMTMTAGAGTYSLLVGDTHTYTFKCADTSSSYDSQVALYSLHVNYIGNGGTATFEAVHLGCLDRTLHTTSEPSAQEILDTYWLGFGSGAGVDVQDPSPSTYQLNNSLFGTSSDPWTGKGFFPYEVTDYDVAGDARAQILGVFLGSGETAGLRSYKEPTSGTECDTTGSGNYSFTGTTRNLYNSTYDHDIDGSSSSWCYLTANSSSSSSYSTYSPAITGAPDGYPGNCNGAAGGRYAFYKVPSTSHEWVVLYNSTAACSSNSWGEQEDWNDEVLLLTNVDVRYAP